MLARTAVLAAFAASALASPLSFIPWQEGNIFWSADITSPTFLTTWKVGSNVSVTWDASKVPQTRQNASGMILLGYQTKDSENLDVQTPLASGFPIVDGQVTLTVPNVTERHDYIVVLFGDSGNASPIFSIVQ
ncbi:hypothetical protein WOLCODRAFT_68060 [Wolfiporia cocos MD-104 SS10]|uniref:Ser-Thr-rich glycosyl-phosphatidyl-inositol-anchored membrane family-domain-containing protein n=1 Tax=Wolfiporia cocos (strain MD-104) TaxID=742152 RepID=A0A2H3JVM4_WOLCO|nr:hypothetical protein WOLCODRAFT_68060 [Wolfiporia cocos MD-104 SS10]